MTLPVVFTANGPSGYNLTKSLRFRSSASAYLNRTPASATNRKIYTWSGWVKLGKLTNTYGRSVLFGSTDNGGANNFFTLSFETNSSLSGGYAPLRMLQYTSGAKVLDRQSTSIYRDPASWYHVVMAVDMTQTTATNRQKVYVNGVEVTAWTNTTTLAQNTDTWINYTQSHQIGIWTDDTGTAFDGYMTEINFVDGQQLTPSSFGSTNALTGVWQPAKYTGTYGTNGFYLPFTDNSATTPVGLGKDFSGNAGTAIVGTTTSGSNSMTVVSLTGIAVGNTVTGPGIPTGTYVTAASVLTVTLSQNATSSNVSQSYTFAGNNWFCNNISLTTGSTYDSMTDVPTLTSATTANYCVLNPLANLGTLTGGNLNVTTASTGQSNTFSTFYVSSGKWYWEVTSTGDDAVGTMIGIAGSSVALTGGFYQSASGYSYYSQGGNKFNNSSGVSYGASYTTGDVIGVALDLSAGTLTFYKNNTSQGTAFTGLTGSFTPAICDGGTGSISVSANFGQRPFTYTPPTGFVALNTYNLPTSTIVKGNTVMDAQLYSGNGTTQTITTASGFKPDLVWIKGRNYADNHTLWNTVVGAQKSLSSDTTTAETTRANALTAFTSTGFTLGTDTIVNYSAGTYVGWQWQAGQGTTSSNTSGSITSTVSVNASAGFSVVTYTGNSSTSATVGHGLGVAPNMIIVKNRTTAGYGWPTYHSSLTSGNMVLLNTTDAQFSISTVSGSGGVPASKVTSSTFGFSAGTSSLMNVNSTSNNYVAYCWSEIAGFSKFTTYVGNASTDGPFVYCGFRPKFIMTKAISTGSIWGMWDSSRNTYNAAGNVLQAQASDVEISPYNIDILSNGFKMRDTNSNWNGSGQTFIVMAFAENPFKNALAR